MIRPTEHMLPEHFLPLHDANLRALRWFLLGAVVFGLIGFAAGRWLA